MLILCLPLPKNRGRGGELHCSGGNANYYKFYIFQNASDLPFVMTYRQGGDRRSKVDGSSTLLGLTNFLKSKKDLPHHDHAMLFTE